MSRIWTTILIGGLGTYSMRACFLATAHKLRDLPPWLLCLLRQIPPAALAALVIPALVRPQGQHFELIQPRFFAGVLAAVVAWRTKNVAVTLVVGMVALVLFRQV